MIFNTAELKKEVSLAANNTIVINIHGQSKNDMCEEAIDQFIHIFHVDSIGPYQFYIRREVFQIIKVDDHHHDPRLPTFNIYEMYAKTSVELVRVLQGLDIAIDAQDSRIESLIDAMHTNRDKVNLDCSFQLPEDVPDNSSTSSSSNMNSMGYLGSAYSTQGRSNCEKIVTGTKCLYAMNDFQRTRLPVTVTAVDGDQETIMIMLPNGQERATDLTRLAN